MLDKGTVHIMSWTEQDTLLRTVCNLFIFSSVFVLVCNSKCIFFIYGIFHLILSYYNWPGVTETTESEISNVAGMVGMLGCGIGGRLYLSEPLLQASFTLGLKLQHMILGRHKHSVHERRAYVGTSALTKGKMEGTVTWPNHQRRGRNNDAK